MDKEIIQCGFRLRIIVIMVVILVFCIYGVSHTNAIVVPVVDVCESISPSVSVTVVDTLDAPTHMHSLIEFETVEPTCQSEGFTVYGCACGDRYIGRTTSVVDHMWGEWVTITRPTADESGKKVCKCVWCEKEYYDIIPAAKRPSNYIGRWSIPSVRVDVGIYRQYADEGGPIVDAWDSATFFYTNSGCTVIGDHNNQGFNAIKRVKIGDMAYIEYENGNVDTYVCVDVVAGHNKVYYLSDADGNSLYDIYQGKLLCYTCNDNWRNVTVVVFDKI